MCQPRDLSVSPRFVVAQMICKVLCAALLATDKNGWLSRPTREVQGECADCVKGARSDIVRATGELVLYVILVISVCIERDACDRVYMNGCGPNR